MSRLQKQEHTFFGGAAILTVGIALVKVIGALYKIPLYNILGEIGTGHFNNAYTIFNILLTISTGGLPVALSKSIAEANAVGRRNQVAKIFRVSLLTFLLLGAVSFLFMFFGAERLAAWLGNPSATYSIMALAPCVLFVCAMAAFRGYAQGHGDMTPTSVSQIIEAFLKLVVGLGLAALVMASALQPLSRKLEYAAAAAIAGVTIGALVGLLYLLLRHWRRRGLSGPQGSDRAEPAATVLSRLLRVAVPITLGASIVSVVTLIDTKLVQNRLQDVLGYSKDLAVGLYGTYQSAMTLYNLPAAFMIALTASIIPAVSAALTRRDPVGAGRISESALRVAALVAMPAGVGLSVLATPIMHLLFTFDSEVATAAAGPILAVLGIASIFVCIMLVCTAILQANGFVNLPILTAVLGGVVKIAVNYVLVADPSLNIQGAPIGTLCCFAVVALLDILLICRVIPNPPNFLRAFAKPLLASVLMGGAAWAVCGLLGAVLPGKLAVVGGILAGGAVYLILVVALRVLSTEDMALMPKGDKIAKILRLK